MNRITVLLLTIIFTVTATAQTTIGLPEIVNFDKEHYNAGTQNWNIRQDHTGTMYYANNEGLLTFDGTYWKLFPLPNKTIVRSVEMGSDNNIYVGGQDEIGFFHPNQTGNLSYSSLKNSLPEGDRTFADIWDIRKFGNSIFFRSENRIFQLTKNRIKVYRSSGAWNFLGTTNKRLIAQDSEKGILQFENERWIPLVSPEDLPSGFIATSAVTFNDSTSLLTTASHGLYRLTNGGLSRFILSGKQISTREPFSAASAIDQERFALGTYSSGCFIIDRSGNVVQHFSVSSGLQNSNVRSLFIDRNKNIWLGLNRGIDFIAYNNAIKHINPVELNDGAGYASVIHNNELYLAMSNGIYHLQAGEENDLSYNKNKFRLVPNTEGQVWGLFLIHNRLLAGKHEGLFQIDNQIAVPLVKGTGYWTSEPLSMQAPSIVAGNYQGIRLLGYQNNTVIPGKTIPGFTESARFVVIDSQRNVWTSHPYRGVYKIQLNGNMNARVKLYTRANGLPSTLNNHVYRIRGKMIVATEKGVYEYDEKADVFTPSRFYRPIFGDTAIRYLKDDTKGNIWFIREKNLAVADFSNKEHQLIYFPELKGKMVSGFEHVFPLDRNNVFIGSEKGFYHINYEKYKQNKQALSVYIRSVEAIGKNDSLLFGGYAALGNSEKAGLQTAIPALHYESNSFQIRYSSPLYEQQANIEYSYFLKGFDKDWSDWTKKTEKDYTYLPAGTYTFSVKARNNLNNESSIASYSFTVLPPWYQTILAYFVYFLVAAGLCILLVKRQKKQLYLQRQKHEEEQKRLQYLHQLELEKSEKEIVKLKNEKLEIEIETKNSELASTAMNLVQKGELLTKIKDDLKRLNKTLKNTEELDDVKKIIRVLSLEEKMHDDWDQFAIHFNKVHSDFLITLKEKYPNLNGHELKLCAYLRMNMTSKEIAQLSNISVRGVELSRYRLRKKLQLPTEVNLFQFFLDIQTQKATVPH